MGTFISAILQTPGATALFGAIVKNGMHRISKTKVGGTALLAVAPDWAALLPAVAEGDAMAIGKLVGIAVAWLMIWMGRGTKG